MRWLVTAFEPFGQAESNSSLIVLRALEKLDWQGKIEFFAPVPVTFAGAWPALKARIGTDIDGVLALGQAETRHAISLERVALNWADARIPDNAGEQPRGRRVRENGPEVHWTTIPWDKLTVPKFCEQSYSAGVYVCNHLFYEIMEWAKSSCKQAGFIHIPLVESQTEARFLGMPRMRDAIAVGALRAVLEELVRG